MDKKKKLYLWVGTILLVGSYCAAGVLALGLVILLLQPPPRDYFASLARPDFSSILSSFLEGEPIGIINLGILMMLLTPFLRVVVAFSSFLGEKDFKYAVVAFGVMVILLFTIVPSFI